MLEPLKARFEDTAEEREMAKWREDDPPHRAEAERCCCTGMRVDNTYIDCVAHVRVQLDACRYNIRIVGQH